MVSAKRSYILKQTRNWKLWVCWSMYDLLADTRCSFYFHFVSFILCTEPVNSWWKIANAEVHLGQLKKCVRGTDQERNIETKKLTNNLHSKSIQKMPHKKDLIGRKWKQQPLVFLETIIYYIPFLKFWKVASWVSVLAFWPSPLLK